MKAIEFRAKIVNGIIEIPEKYRKLTSQLARIIILTEELTDLVPEKEAKLEIYPFSSDAISFENTTFLLNKKIKGEVSYEDGNYIISYSPLDITVWGDSREEAEEAFSFQFYALYENYFNEQESKLTNEAISLKRDLHNLIKQVIVHENTKG